MKEQAKIDISDSDDGNISLNIRVCRSLRRSDKFARLAVTSLRTRGHVIACIIRKRNVRYCRFSPEWILIPLPRIASHVRRTRTRTHTRTISRTHTYSAVLETIPRQLETRKKHPPMISRSVAACVMAYFCTDDRTESRAIIRHWLVFTYRTSLHGNTRAITPPRQRGTITRIVRAGRTERSVTRTHRNEGRNTTDLKRVALAPEHRRRSAAKCAPLALANTWLRVSPLPVNSSRGAISHDHFLRVDKLNARLCHLQFYHLAQLSSANSVTALSRTRPHDDPENAATSRQLHAARSRTRIDIFDRPTIVRYVMADDRISDLGM